MQREKTNSFEEFFSLFSLVSRDTFSKQTTRNVVKAQSYILHVQSWCCSQDCAKGGNSGQDPPPQNEGVLAEQRQGVGHDQVPRSCAVHSATVENRI